ncbi:hypothetical protein FXN61_00530 [Lentzea sp. PSKA42]|uniref:Uncharacterized protein n=1 Tax=Lentzea indica TaxID=2604800 RepID=A0ABX1F9I4_9PSEU|nr:hypothetical protein [Lentzea indica]NKE55393.1 hypothetical protein [Lentzea indica]
MDRDDLVGRVTIELDSLARRVLTRAFVKLGGQGALELRELREISSHLAPGGWDVATLERVLRFGIEQLDGRFEKISAQEAALLLFNLDGSPGFPEISSVDLQLIDEKKYSYLFDRLAKSAGLFVSDNRVRDRVLRLRRSLASALVDSAYSFGRHAVSHGISSVATRTSRRELDHGISEMANMLSTGDAHLDSEEGIPPVESFSELPSAGGGVAIKQRGRQVRPTTVALVLLSATVLTVGATLFISELVEGGSGSSVGGDLKDASADALPIKIQDITTFRNSARDHRFVLSDVVAEPPRVLALRDEVPSSGGEGFHSWFDKHGGTALESGFTNITVQGNSAKPVRITDIKIATECSPPISGTFLMGYTQGGGRETIKIGFNLDNPNPIPEQMTLLNDGLQGSGVNYFAGQTIELASGETEVLTVGAYTKRQHCKFKLKLVVATEKGSFLQEIDSSGKKFEVTGMATAKENGLPYSGYQKIYRQGPTLSWESVDPKTPIER